MGRKVGFWNAITSDQVSFACVRGSRNSSAVRHNIAEEPVLVGYSALRMATSSVPHVVQVMGLHCSVVEDWVLKYDALSLENQFPTFRSNVVPSEGYTAVENRPDLCLRLATGLKLSFLILTHQIEGQVLSDLVNFICIIRFSKKYLNHKFIPLFVPRTSLRIWWNLRTLSQQNLFKSVKCG